MAVRPIFKPVFDGECLVLTEDIDFKWHAGMAPIQRMKSVEELHKSAIEAGFCKHPLEVSTKSIEALGKSLSAFNLSVKTEKYQREFTVETAYQSSKVFEMGGPYKDILNGTSLAAKKDERLKTSGALTGFEFFGVHWLLEPRTAFYDWIYLNALRKNQWAADELSNYDAFTDIEFNPNKSFNCQAYSVALFQSLSGRGLLKDALESKESFLSIVGGRPVSSASENTIIQPSLC